MPAFLSESDTVIRARITNAMQGRLREQELQIDALVDRYIQLFDREVARFAQAQERTHPITTDIVTVQGLNDLAMQGLRDTVQENDPVAREAVWQAYQASYEPTDSEQRAYEDAPYDRLEDEAHGTEEPPYADTRTALNEALWDVLERQDQYHPQSAEYGDLAVERHELEAAIRALGTSRQVPEIWGEDMSRPGTYLGRNDSEIGPEFYAGQIQQLQERLARHPEAETTQEHEGGMGY